MKYFRKEDLFVKKLSFIAVLLLFSAAGLTVAEALLSTFQCPGMADESWTLYIIKNDIPSQFSFFVKYLGFAKDWTFEAHRLLGTLIRLFSGMFLGMSFFMAFKSFGLKRIDAFVMGGGIPCLYSLSLFAGVSSYVTLNYVFGCISLGCLLYAVRGECPCWGAWVLMAASGASIAQCVFIMPPNAVLVPVMMVTLLLVGRQWLLPFCIGGFLGVGVFFALVCSPHSFMDSVAFFQTLNFANTDGHDIKMLFRWLYATISGYIPIVLFSAVFAVGSKSLNARKRWYWAVLVGMGIYSVLHAYGLLRFGIYRGSMVRVDCCIMYFVVLALLFRRIWEDSSVDDADILMFLFLACPLCLCFGTNVEFDHRASRYMIFLLLPIWVLTRKYSSKFGYAYMVLMVMIYFVFMLWHVRLVNGYTGVRFIDAKRSLREFGTRCLTTDSVHAELLRIQDATKDRPVMVGGRDSWRTVVLLGKTPLSPLWYKTELAASLLQKQNISKERLFLLEQRHTFELSPEKEHEIAAVLCAERVERIKISEHTSVVLFR